MAPYWLAAVYLYSRYMYENGTKTQESGIQMSTANSQGWLSYNQYRIEYLTGCKLNTYLSLSPPLIPTAIHSHSCSFSQP